MSTSQYERVPPIRGLREARGLGLRETARRADIDPAHLLRVERGDAGLSLDSLQRLAAVLGPPELVLMLDPYVER